MSEEWTLERLKQLKEIVDCMIEDSNSSIIQSNFIGNFYKYTIDGLIHPGIRLFGAKSFRPTCSQPNMLQTPSTGSVYAKPVKQCFIAPEGWIWVMADLSALEDRVIANLSKDENKLNIFLEDLDGHCLHATYYFADKLDKILPRLPDESLADYTKRFAKEIADGNKELKTIRQSGKSPTFALSYGAFPPKLASTAKIPLEEAEKIFEKYHDELYPGITKFRNETEDTVRQKGRVHLGLGCYLNSTEPSKKIRTLFNARSQFWSILTLLTVNELHYQIDQAHLTDDVKICITIYDSIYILCHDDLDLIKWVNDTTIPILCTQYLEDQPIPNAAVAELGYDWASTVAIANNAPLDVIEQARDKARELFDADDNR